MAVKTADISLTLGVGAMIPTIEQQIAYQTGYDDPVTVYTVKIPCATCPKCGARRHFDRAEWQFGRIWAGTMQCTTGTGTS